MSGLIDSHLQECGGTSPWMVRVLRKEDLFRKPVPRRHLPAESGQETGSALGEEDALGIATEALPSASL